VVEQVTPVAKRLGCAEELAGIVDILDRGPSYLRQRRLYADTADFRALMGSLVREFRQGIG